MNAREAAKKAVNNSIGSMGEFNTVLLRHIKHYVNDIAAIPSPEETPKELWELEVEEMLSQLKYELSTLIEDSVCNHLVALLNEEYKEVAQINFDLQKAAQASIALENFPILGGSDEVPTLCGSEQQFIFAVDYHCF